MSENVPMGNVHGNFWAIHRQPVWKQMKPSSSGCC
jgi:hypothetical protein